MRKIYVRNYLVFVTLLILSGCWLGFNTISQIKAVKSANAWITHTTKVILNDYEMIQAFEDVLSTQRSFMVSGEEVHLKQLKLKQLYLDQKIKTLKTLTSDNNLQNNRVDAIQIETEKLNFLISDQIKSSDTSRKNALRNLNLIDKTAYAIAALNDDFLREEHLLLEKRASKLSGTNSNLISVFMIGGSVFLLILLFFNSYILKSQIERLEAVEELETAQQRLDLAFEGMNEGVFDWDVFKNEVFYSERFIEMLGYEKDEFEPNYEQFERLLHPEDKDAVRGVLDAYLGQHINEYSAVFRMQHKNGKWLWINSRAKALFDKDGNAVRLTGSHRDITDAREIEHHLIEATKKAEKANRAKSEFLAHMSHEIRTPLTAVTGIAEILDMQSKESDPKKKKLIKTLLNSAESLKDLISDVLDISKIEADEIKIMKSEFPLDDMFNNVKNMMEIKAQEKGLEFEFNFDDFQNKVFYGDRIRIRQILVNLIGNAIKFTDTGYVKIKPLLKEIDKTKSELTISVKDSGIGIPKKDQESIFSKFKQGDSSVSRKYGGTGLGLHISCELIRMMGGDINLKSAKDKGSTFTMSLPYQTSEMQSLSNIPKEAKIKATKNVKGRKALIVEDYEANVIVISHILEGLDIRYDHAENGLEAVSKFKKNKYDFVLMDIQMPEMDGFRATIEIRKHEDENLKKPTPIIAMTAHALTSEREKCFQVGMDDFVTKPIDMKDLKVKITALFKVNKKAA